MRLLQSFLRPIGLVIILVMAGVAALGFYSIRKDVASLKVINPDNILWSATQMEIELLRFQRALAFYRNEPTEEALDDVHLRFDILWSRFDLIPEGRVGDLLRQHDEGFGTLTGLESYLDEIDPVILGLSPGDAAPVTDILTQLERWQSELRQYTLRVVRSESAAATSIQERVKLNSIMTASLGLAALGVCLISIVLIMRDNARQREMVAINLRQAEAAEAASRSKSRFLTMMSHELRNPLNGILGPLALLGQSDLGDRQTRLIARAQQSGRTMIRMLRGLLDFGDIEDQQLVLKREAFRPRTLAEEVTLALGDLASDGGAEIDVSVDPDMPELIWGDHERLAQIFVYLGEYMLQPGEVSHVRVRFTHDGTNLVGDIAFDDAEDRFGWKLDLLMGMSKEGHRPFSSDALGPLIARGLLAAAHGVLTLAEDATGRRIVRVVVPARSVVFDKIRVHLETRSSALETLYRAALRSDRVVFLPPETTLKADIVLVDSTSVGEVSLMGALRARFPDALFVSLGLPAAPGHFDEIVEAPHDMVRLRKSVLGRLAS